jgi:hypothetical protein
MRRMLWILLFALAGPWAQAQDAVEEAVDEVADEAVEEAAEEAPRGNGVDSPKTMSGMSILGNEEAPKSLVIVPWKSSRMGDELSLSDTLDDRAQPVDKEVFLRELRFYAIRSGEET